MAFQTGGAKRGYSSPVIVDSIAVAKQYKQPNNGSDVATIAVDPNKPMNVPFDARSWGTTSLRRNRLLRGRLSMLTGEGNVAGATSGAYGSRKGLHRSLNFLYNPDAVTHNFQFNPDMQPGEFAGPNDQGVATMAGQSIGFKLAFQRIYESAQGRDGGIGVLADTKVLELILGASTGGVAGLYSQDVLVVFGVSQSAKPFAFRGWISSCNITYTRFNHRMVPIEAVVDLTIARRHQFDNQMPTEMPPVGDRTNAQAYQQEAWGIGSGPVGPPPTEQEAAEDFRQGERDFINRPPPPPRRSELTPEDSARLNPQAPRGAFGNAGGSTKNFVK